MSEERDYDPHVDTTATPHMLAKVVIGAIAAFAIGKVTDAGYDALIKGWHRRKEIV